MSLGVIAEKCGMTRVFDESTGASTPVTVMLVSANRVTQLKSVEKDGYCAVQLTHGEQKVSRLSKAEAGHFSKNNILPGKGLREFRISEEVLATLALGGEVSVDLFKVGQKVDVTGITKGKGFSGVIRRHHFSSQRATHGNSLSHRVPGSIGQNQSPGRVFKGKKMAGQHGNARRTTQNLEVVKLDLEQGLLLVKGAVPGATGGFVIIRPATKYQGE